MPDREKLGLVVGTVLLGLMASLVIDLPIQGVYITVLGTTGVLYVSTPWLVGPLLAGIVSAGLQSLLQDHPSYRAQDLGYSLAHWALPALGVFSAPFILRAVPPSAAALVASMTLSGVVLSLVCVCQYRSLDRRDPAFGWARLGTRLVSYGLAAALFILLFALGGRGLEVSIGSALVAVLLAVELLRGAPEIGRAWLYAWLIGLILLQLALAINYWGIGASSGGLSLFLAFYLSTGLARQHLRGALDRRVALEFALAAALSLALLWRAFDWSW
jgi:hypothetical protein